MWFLCAIRSEAKNQISAYKKIPPYFEMVSSSQTAYNRKQTLTGWNERAQCACICICTIWLYIYLYGARDSNVNFDAKAWNELKPTETHTHIHSNLKWKHEAMRQIKAKEYLMLLVVVVDFFLVYAFRLKDKID